MRCFLALVLASALAALAAPMVMLSPRVALAKEAPAAAPKSPRGAIVVATSPPCRDAAKALARIVYADSSLRPDIDEATARALVADWPAPPPAEPKPKPARQPDDLTEPSAVDTPTEDAVPKAAQGAAAPRAELREVVAGIGAACRPQCGSSSVARRLIASLGRELGAHLVVVVSCTGDESAKPAQIQAQVLQLADERFVPMVLSTQIQLEATPKYPWTDAVRILRGLIAPRAQRPSPRAPSTTPAGRRADRRSPASERPAQPVNGAADTAEKDGEDEGLDLLTSPWFWGGLGAVVAVGVTVFALSQTSLNEPDVIRLEGRVSP